MNRTEKSEMIDVLKEKFLKASAAFVTEYRGMTVGSLDELRNKVRAGQGEVKVIKNRLAKIATKGSAFEHLIDELKGPIALALSYKDPVPVAKALAEAISDTSPFKLRIGSLGGKFIKEKEIVALSKLPDRNTLLSMMLSAMQGPARGFAVVLNAVPQNFAQVLNAVKEQKAKQA